jgi:succinate dehydrogenase/fumarate reductase flavoprotein subunit
MKMVDKLEQIADEVIKTDFLIIGGGLVGSMAAIRARKKSKDIDITIIDKATMEYSGDGTGLDNFLQVPLRKQDAKKHDVGADDAKKAVFGTNRFKGLTQVKLDQIQMEFAYVSQPILEEIGVQVSEDDGTNKVIQGYRKGTVWGRVEYDKNGKPTEPFFGTVSRGTDLKMKLGAAVRKSGVRVYDRTMVTSVITKGGTAVGATAFNTRTGKFYVFKAKAILMATGGMSRLYPYKWAPYPNRLFYTLASPVLDGGGHVTAYNAGAKMYSMEMTVVYNVSKGINHSSGGGACNWYFKMYNSKGEILEDKYPDSIVTKQGGMIPGVNFLYSPNIANAEFEHDVIKSAKDKAELDEIVGTYFTAVTEPPKALKFHKLAGGLTNESPAECIAVIIGKGNTGSGGIFRENEQSETSVKNLFAAGNCVGRGSSSGFTWGCLIADHVVQMVKSNKQQIPFDSDQVKQVEETKSWVYAPLGREVPHKVNPMELEDYVRGVNDYFIGIHRSKGRLERAIELIQLAKKGAVPMLSVNNYHNLMRAIEVQNIIEVSEQHAQSALLRTESRLLPMHYRDDYPKEDPAWDNIVVTVKKVSGKAKYQKEYLNKE